MISAVKDGFSVEELEHLAFNSGDVRSVSEENILLEIAYANKNSAAISYFREKLQAHQEPPAISLPLGVLSPEDELSFLDSLSFSDSDEEHL